MMQDDGAWRRELWNVGTMPLRMLIIYVYVYVRIFPQMNIIIMYDKVCEQYTIKKKIFSAVYEQVCMYVYACMYVSISKGNGPC